MIALKIALGVLLAGAVLLVGCGALLNVGFNGVQSVADEHAITQAQFDSVKSGPRGNSRKRILSRFGDPQVVEEPPGQAPAADADCIYYNRRGNFLSTYELCFDSHDRVKSKTAM